jgi:PmbA protein
MGDPTQKSGRLLSVAALKKDEMISIAENAVGLAQSKGAAEAESYVYEGQSTSVGLERGQITKSTRIIDRGLGVRVSVNKAIGFAYTNVLDKQTAVEDTIVKALDAAKASRPDQDWHGLPGKKDLARVENTFDKRIAELHAEDLVNLTSKMLDAAVQGDKRVLAIEGGAGAGFLTVAIANSNGISAFDTGTMIECSIATVAKEGNTVTPVCFEFNAARNYSVDPEWVGKEASRLAVSALKTKGIETKTTKLVLTQFALQELLYFTLINAVKADNVQRNQSAFKGKLGEKVASDNVTIYDDGLLAGGLRTAKFDGEGSPHQKTPIIEKGILRSFLYDNYAAKKDGVESTGNASRAGYLSTPNIEATNFHIASGNVTADELMAEVDEGLIVYYLQGAHSSNPVSGEFSVVATPAWKVKKGEIKHCSRGVMLAGNIFEVLKNVRVVANNERQMGQLVSPWILVENVHVIGR